MAMKKITSPGRFLTFGAYPRKFVQLLESEWAVPPETLLADTGIEYSQLDNPELLVPFAEVVTIFRNGVAACSAPDLALRYATRLRPSSHGLLGAAVLTVGSLQDAIDLFYDYIGLVAPFLLMHQEDRRSSRVLVFEMISDVPVNAPFTFDIMLLSTFNILKLILGERTRELVFHFAHPTPANAADYDTYFDGYVQFNASFYGVSIPHNLLDSPVETADADTHRLLVNQISSRMEMARTQNSFVDAVRFHLKRADGPLPRMSIVADTFNMSARTFRNRLRRNNTSYQSLLDCERHEQAVGLLRNSEKSVKEIAYTLGFQESSNFSRVFKKWTGVTPLDFRRNKAIS